MSDFCKAEFRAVYSEKADFSSPETDTYSWLAYQLSAPTVVDEKKLTATTGGTTAISLAGFTTVKLLAVKNESASNYVTVIYRTAGGGATDQTHRIPAGGLLVLSDVTQTTNPTIQANTAACVCKVFIAGT